MMTAFQFRRCQELFKKGNILVILPPVLVLWCGSFLAHSGTRTFLVVQRTSRLPQAAQF